MNVPRGTPVTKAGAWRAVCLHLPRPYRLALARDMKSELRMPLTRDNSTVQPGHFAGLDLESGRARRGNVPELRARCEFPSGKVRVVTVSPTFGRGDLLWVRNPKGTRALSRLTLEVVSVDVARLQDMSDANARAEGVGALPARLRFHGTPRDWFAMWWETWKGPRAWRRNDWVWVLRFRTHHENVDDLLARWRAAS